jgi:DNA polymerase III sliding clamp (beta) subunit (PCNA family)
MQRINLVKTLELVKPALATIPLIPIFECFNFTNGTVSAFDDNIAIIGPTEFEETCGIHGATLLGLLSNIYTEDVDFELKDDTVIIQAGKSVSKLPIQTEENFIFKAPDEGWTFKIPLTSSFFEALSMCLETVSKDATQQALHGITIEGTKMYSCDSDSLTRVQLKNGVKKRAFLSSKFSNALLKLWNELEITKGVLNFSDKWVYANLGEWEIYGQVLALKDPIDFEALIKKNVGNGVVTKAIPDDLSEALSRARVIADPESQKTEISITKGVLKLRTETHMGVIRDDLIFKGHADIDIQINASLVQRALEHADKIAFLGNCTVLEKEDVFQLVSNMG